MIHKTLQRCILVWIGSLLYYNAIECILIADMYRHFDMYRIPVMNMKLAFIIYPIIVYLACSANRFQSKSIRLALQPALCIVYSSVVVYFNIPIFPLKTWVIVVISFSCIIICIWIDKKINTTIHIDNEKHMNWLFSVFFCFLIIMAIVCTAFCHSYMI